MHSARTRAGLTLDEVGKALGITGGAVSRWESESSYPSRKNLEQFAKLVGVSVAWLAFAVSAPEVEARRRVPMRNPWAPAEEAAVPASIECRFPCSASAFAIELLEGEYAGILVVDPEARPEHGDLVLIMEGEKPEIRSYSPESAFSKHTIALLDKIMAELSNAPLASPPQHKRLIEARNAIAKFRWTILPASTKIMGVVVEHTRGRYGGPFINRRD